MEFCRLSGQAEAAVICELVDDGVPHPARAEHEDPGMLRGERCVAFARRWGLKVCTIAELVCWLEKKKGRRGLGRDLMGLLLPPLPVWRSE